MANQSNADLVKREIVRFLKSEEPEVLCIRGKWGVGKTYSWKQYLKEAFDRGQICTSAKGALIAIGKESALNRRRVENYGFPVD